MWHSSPKEIIIDEEVREFLQEWFDRRVTETNPDICWFLDGKRKNHYSRVQVKGVQHTAHRASFELHFGKPPRDKPYVIHSCDERSCVNPNHLRCGTIRDNMIDMRFGSKPLTLSERDEEVIIFMRSLNYTYKEIAKKFDSSIYKVRLICLGKHGYKVLPKSYKPR